MAAKSTHQHTWITNLYVFPDAPGVYEFDVPYVTEYCGDRDCGQRQARKITDEEAAAVAKSSARSPWISLEDEAARTAAIKEVRAA